MEQNPKILKLRIIYSSIIFCFIIWSLLISSGTAVAPFPVNDAHCHIVDITQESNGLVPLLLQMNETGVDHAVIFGFPVIKKWSFYEPVRPRYYNDNDDRVYYYSLTDALVAHEYLSLTPDQRERFYPFLCGFNPTDMNAVDQIERMMSLYPGVFVGIGEVLFRHDDLSRLLSDEQPRVNHPALDQVYKYAAEHDMPVFIHSNIGTPAYRDPVYGSEVEEILANHPDTRFVWCHAGYTQNLNITGYPGYMREMFEKYPNLWVDITWVIYTDLIAKDGTVNDEWLELIQEFPDRFLIGTDSIGDFSFYHEDIRKYDLLLNQLDDHTRDRVAYWNLYDILPKSVKRPNPPAEQVMIVHRGDAGNLSSLQ